MYKRQTVPISYQSPRPSRWTPSAKPSLTAVAVSYTHLERPGHSPGPLFLQDQRRPPTSNRSLTPVSYTHLDVYKRQLSPFSQRLPVMKRRCLPVAASMPKSFTVSRQAFEQPLQRTVRCVGASASISSSDRSPLRGTFGPVSYTHLDVYKRQAMYVGPSATDEPFSRQLNAARDERYARFA